MMCRKLLVIVTIVTCVGLTSCTIVSGLDPAEKLSTMIETKSKDLQSSERKFLEFEYFPNIDKVKQSPKYDGSVSVAARVRVNKTDIEGRSVIQVANWFTTTYHNRFVHVHQAMERIKKAGEPFRIRLVKENGKVVWSAIK